MSDEASRQRLEELNEFVKKQHAVTIQSGPLTVIPGPAPVPPDFLQELTMIALEWADRPMEFTDDNAAYMAGEMNTLNACAAQILEWVDRHREATSA